MARQDGAAEIRDRIRQANRRRLLVGATALACAAGLGRRTVGQDDLAWQTLPEMPLARSELAAAAIEEAIYVVAGFGGGARVDRFGVGDQAWHQVADLPAELNHPGVAALNGLLYVAGGFNRSFFADDRLHVYDPEIDAWAERAPLPDGRGALGLVALDGRLFAVGGTREGLGGSVTAAVDAYDPDADVWETVTTMPTPREHLAVAAGDGRIWTAGGRAAGDDGPPLAATAEVYDPATDSWESLPPLPTPRGGLAGAWAGGHFVTLGGETIFAADAPRVHAEAEAFDPIVGDWVTLPPLPTPRHGLAAVGIGDTLYAVAGGTIAGSADGRTGAVEALRFE
jgi:N-acetylneuraminic acid mutarotase